MKNNPDRNPFNPSSNTSAPETLADLDQFCEKWIRHFDDIVGREYEIMLSPGDQMTDEVLLARRVAYDACVGARRLGGDAIYTMFFPVRLYLHPMEAITKLRAIQLWAREGGRAVHISADEQATIAMRRAADQKHNDDLLSMIECVRKVSVTAENSDATEEKANDEAASADRTLFAAVASLGIRHRELLQGMWRTGAADRQTRRSAAEIAKVVVGPQGSAEDFKAPLAELNRLGLVRSMRGRSGGSWLTDLGVRAAQTIEEKRL